MGRVMEKLKIFVVQEPVVAASCLIAGVGCMIYLLIVYKKVPVRTIKRGIPFIRILASLLQGLFLPAVVRPILDSFETAKQVPQPALSDVVAGVTGKRRD